MGCNAWNHSPDCNCGWGGVNYGVSAPLTSQTVWHELSSFTNPNAYCPVCGAKVFFYKFPYGGSVFFDNLGPPWPKHPCTDWSIEKRKPVRSSVRTGKRNLSEDQWTHFPCISVERHPLLATLVVLKSPNGSRSGTLYFIGKRDLFDSRTPFLIKPVKSKTGAYELSTLTHHLTRPQEIRVGVFNSRRALCIEYPALLLSYF